MPRLLLLVATIAVAALTTTMVQGVQVGPRLTPKPSPEQDIYETKEFLKTRMNIPSLRLAIPALNAGIPDSAKAQQDQGIWPELRKSETIWTALKIKEWMHRYNQFDSIVVSADTTVSADVYLLGEILQSDGEIMRIAYYVVDATGEVWFPRTTSVYRVKEGWFERNERTNRDPFDPLYNEIAETVYEALKDRGKAHVEQLERQSKRPNSQNSLTGLQRIAMTRDLVFAAFLSPEEFGDSLKVVNNRYQIQYLPYSEGSDWGRVTSIQAREEDFSEVIERYYEEFSSTIEDDYGQWQRDSFPLAREVRLAKRGRTVKGVLGTLILAAAAVSSKDGAADDGDGSAELATKLGALTGAALVTASFMENAKRKRAVDEINEIGGSLHNSLRPTRVDLNGKIVTLSGSVQDQFTQWRTMLTEMYESNQQDFESVRVLSDDELAHSE